MSSWQSRALKFLFRRVDLLGLNGGLSPQRLAKLRSRMDGMAWMSAFYPVKISADHAYSVPCEWVVPNRVRADLVLLYIHGGAWCLGSPKSNRAVIANLAKNCGTRALSIDYRLAPEHPYPAPVDDSLEAYQWLIHAQGIAPERIVLVGDSSGGHLVLSTLVALRGMNTPMPGAAVVLSPPTDFARTGPSHKVYATSDPLFSHVTEQTKDELAKNYAGELDPRDPRISPLYADLRGLPPMLVFVGEEEIFRDDSIRFAERARHHGCAIELKVWPGMFHLFHMFDFFLPEARSAAKEIAVFIESLEQGRARIERRLAA